MNIAEIVQSSAWKNFMAKLYGIGAAVVIVGALFKIMHWPGAGIMLTAGLATEAVIFFSLLSNLCTKNLTGHWYILSWLV